MDNHEPRTVILHVSETSRIETKESDAFMSACQVIDTQTGHDIGDAVSGVALKY